MPKRLVFLLIMDGWGINPRSEGNAIKTARTPNLDRLTKEYLHTQIAASGLSVGLPKDVMGNSEVGHLNLGAGRVVWQEITRIDRAIEDGSFFKNPTLLQAMQHARQNNSALHLLGLVSDGKVHSSDTHYFTLLEMAKQQGLKPDQVFFHAALDGRDTPPKSGIGYVEQLINKTKEIGIGQVVTISGRYYLMDRDKRWDRLQKAYDALTIGEGFKSPDAVSAVKEAYARGETDEFVKPTVIVDQKNQPMGRIKDNDSIIFFNFRADRAREMTSAFVEKDFKGFSRRIHPKVAYTGMTLYDETIDIPTAFKPVHLVNILGEVLAQHKIPQLRIAETEKYAHVTYFFNGGQEKPFPNEDRIMVPSPKVATYDLQPEMSAPEITPRVLEAISSNKYRVIILNYANGDMVGHTGVFKAAVKAIETVDKYVGRVVDAVLDKNGTILITADHGNAEEMIDIKTGQPHTYHTTNPVPLLLVDKQHKGQALRGGGKLCDMAPTMLNLLDLAKPAEMEGTSLC